MNCSKSKFNLCVWDQFSRVLIDLEKSLQQLGPHSFGSVCVILCRIQLIIFWRRMNHLVFLAQLRNRDGHMLVPSSLLSVLSMVCIGKLDTSMWNPIISFLLSSIFLLLSMLFTFNRSHLWCRTGILVLFLQLRELRMTLSLQLWGRSTGLALAWTSFLELMDQAKVYLGCWLASAM